MRSIVISILLLFSGSVFAQCKFVSTAGTTFGKIPEGKTTFYINESKVPANAQEVGLIICECDDVAQGITAAKKLSYRNGANGLYLMNSKDNDLLVSRDKSNIEKEMNEGKKRRDKYESKMTFVAIRVDDTVQMSQSSINFQIGEEVRFEEDGEIKVGRIMEKHPTTVTVRRHGASREIAYNKLTKK